VEQTFRNHTSRALEATYVFPVPRGASVREFAMWVDGKRVKSELVEAAKARRIYTDIVRRLQDPGLLEYLGADLLQMRVYPVPARGEQKIELSYTALAKKDHELVEYTYPVRTDGKCLATLDDFTLKLKLKSQHPILSVYSPTHAISITRASDREAIVGFEKHQALIDRDFQLYYTVGDQDVGLTALMHRPSSHDDGYFLLLLSPRLEWYRDLPVPQDVVFVLDTSGSMGTNGRDGKLEQARKALFHCLGGLSPDDRFAVVQYATTVNTYKDHLVPASRDQVERAGKWLGRMEAVGGTALDEALQAALGLQDREEGRPFTVVFFTDGKPTLGETKPDRILANLAQRNTARTRVFTFGVGHDLDAALLDQIAERTRAASTFVRPGEDLEVKASSFFDKIRRPVLTNLKLTSSGDVRLVEMYPPQPPDLFHGGQLVLLGRYQGTGEAKLRLTGTAGSRPHEFDYHVRLPASADGRSFVEDLWARRKVGYLLEQIRLGGEKKELVDSVIALAKKYGIATPYTSYLVVPDVPAPVVPPWRPRPPRPFPVPIVLEPLRPGEPQRKLAEMAGVLQQRAGDLARNRGKLEDDRFAKLPADADGNPALAGLVGAREQKSAYDAAQRALHGGFLRRVQTDKLGVDLSVQVSNLKNQSQMQPTALRRVAGRNCLEIGGVWMDEGFDPKRPLVAVKAMSDAYFRLLERQPQLTEVFQLGNHVVWVAPNETALVIDTTGGREEMADAEIDRLFAR
jgi:Ca-activated chloride channel family protein